MKIPRRVKVGRVWYPVHLVRDPVVDGRTVCGYCVKGEGIWLNSNYPALLWDILWHELVHLICWHNAIDEIDVHPSKERIVDSLGLGIAAVLANNRGLVSP